jgi:hypothetical protein
MSDKRSKKTVNPLEQIQAPLRLRLRAFCISAHAFLIGILFLIPQSGIGEMATPFVAEMDQVWDAVAVPRQIAPLFSAQVTRVEPGGKVFISSSVPDACLALVNEVGPAYLEVTGPANHGWLGHRLELGTGLNAVADGLYIKVIPSPRSTRTDLDASLVGAEIRIYPHVTLPLLLERNTSWILKTFPQSNLRYYLTTETGFQEFWPRLNPSQPGVSWCIFDDQEFTWISASLEDLVIAPGECFVIRNGTRRGTGFSLTGSDRTNLPCPRPWKGKGPHLIGYPFSADLQLGRDWPRQGVGLTPSENPADCDYIGVYLPDGYRTYGFFGRSVTTALWREIIKPGTRRAAWGAITSTITTIPAGQGFLLYPRKDAPDHIFYPPQQ